MLNNSILTWEKFSTLIVGCLLQKYGHFCSIHKSSSLLHVLSSTLVDVTYKRGKKLCILSYLFFLSGWETTKRIRSQLTPPVLAPSSREKEKLRATNSNRFPIFYPKHQPESSLSVLCHLSLVLRTQLSLWSHPTPGINVLHSFCSACTSHSGQRTCFKTALKAAETFPHSCHFVVG